MQANLSKYGVIALLACLTLTSCVGTGDGGSVPLIPVGGGNSTPSSSPRIAPPIFKSDSAVPSGQYEQHGAVKKSDCYEKERRFQAQGRRVKLVKIVPNDLNKGGGVLQFICLFEGADAIIEPAVTGD